MNIVNGTFELSGPLYEAGFLTLKDETLAFLGSTNQLTFEAIEYTRRILLLESIGNLKKILNGINYLGFSENIIPIHSWHYLQNAARYFANQAIQAERTYINFKDNAEREEFSRLMLEQAVDAHIAALNVENRKVDAAMEQQRVAELNADLAQDRLENADTQKQDFNTMSEKLAYFDEMTAFTNASDRKVRLSQEWAAFWELSMPK